MFVCIFRPNIVWLVVKNGHNTINPKHYHRKTVLLRCSGGAVPHLTRGVAHLCGRSSFNPQHSRSQPLLLSSPRLIAVPSRGAAMFIGQLLRGVLKIRYLLLGGAVGGGVTLNKVSLF